MEIFFILKFIKVDSYINFQNWNKYDFNIWHKYIELNY